VVNSVVIYTDGACRGNPGVGGWAATLSIDGHLKELSGAERLTTNNRMELTAVKNQDLWEQLDKLAAGHRIQWHWVKGHSGNEGNERVDRLANEAIDALVR
jgi:ribonuclease HI